MHVFEEARIERKRRNDHEDAGSVEEGGSPIEQSQLVAKIGAALESSQKISYVVVSTRVLSISKDF